jgi:hypothetical protein
VSVCPAKGNCSDRPYLLDCEINSSCYWYSDSCLSLPASSCTYYGSQISCENGNCYWSEAESSCGANRDSNSGWNSVVIIIIVIPIVIVIVVVLTVVGICFSLKKKRTKQGVCSYFFIFSFNVF